jgi:hypothetical protein
VGAVLNLTSDSLYVVSWKTDSALRVHPAGLVTVTKEAGPLRLRGKFVDSNGKIETRTYAGPCIYILEPVAGKVGRIELDLIPYGFKTDADIYSAAVDVNGGTGPQPPPKPEPQPDPTPVPIAATWVLVIEESAMRTAPIALLLNDFAMWKRLEAKGVKWRIYDVDSPDVKAKKYDVAVSGVGVPAVLMLDAAGKIVKVAKLPATAAELEALVK